MSVPITDTKAGRPSLTNQFFIKPIDDASAPLLLGLLKGSIDGTAAKNSKMLIAVYSDTADLAVGRKPVYQVLLTSPAVTALGATGTAGSTPSESLAVVFSALQVTINIRKADGSDGASYTYSFDLTRQVVS
jgi:type VI protein secretion system component Hcp